MTRRGVYLDSSAVVKLVFEEAETAALEEFLTARPLRLSSMLARLEVVRTARTVDDPLVTRHTYEVLAALLLVAPDAPLLIAASTVEPHSLKSLNAIHLATARALLPDIEGMVVYDARLAEAARHAGITVWAPS